MLRKRKVSVRGHEFIQCPLGSVCVPVALLTEIEVPHSDKWGAKVGHSDKLGC